MILIFNYPVIQCERNFKVHQTQPAGQSMDITDELEMGKPWLDSTKNAQLTRINRYQLEILFIESGIALEVWMYSTHLNFWAYVPDTYRDRVQGFLGNMDENRNNEFHTRENTNPLQNINTDQEIYPHLENHCELFIIVLQVKKICN